MEKEGGRKTLNANDISSLPNLLPLQGRRVGAHHEEEDGDMRSGMSLESVQYFPHNDSAQIQFSCPLPAPEGGGAVPSRDLSRTRTVTCSFAEEQATEVSLLLLRFGIGPFYRMNG